MDSLLLHGQSALSITFSPTVASWCELTVPCADVGLHMRVTWCSAFKFCVLPTGYTQCHESTGSDGPTRTVTSDFVSATLAEAATQLSFAAFLERCISVSASPAAPATHPHPTSGCRHADYSTHRCLSGRLYATLVRGVLGSTLSTHDVLCPTCSRPVPSLPLDASVQTPLHSVVAHDASTQLPLTEFFIGCILSNDPSDRQASPSAHCNADSVSHLHNPLTLRRFAAPAAPAMLATVTSTLQPHVCYYSRHWVSRSMPVSTPHMENLLKRHRCVCVHLSQSRSHSHMSVPPKWEHILCAQLLPTREVQVPPWREPTILSVQILVQELALFINREPLFFPWSNLVNPNLKGLVTLIQPTAISCIINTGTAAQEPRQYYCGAVKGSMRLFFKKPVVMSRTYQISSLHTLATRTSPSCSTRTPSSPTPRCLPSGETPQAKVLGAWFYSSFEHCCAAAHLPGHQLSHFAQYTFTMSLPRNVTHPLSYFSGFTGT